MARSPALLSVLVLLLGCDEPRQPRHEQLPDTTFVLGAPNEVTLTREQLENDARPRAEAVRVLVLTPEAVQVPVERLDVEVGASSKVTFAFHPPRAQVLELVVDWGAAVGTTTQRGFVVEVLDAEADEQRSYPYRIEQCRTVQRAVTRTFCEQDGEVFVYDASGLYEQTIAGRELRVVGDEVWVSQAAGLSHWTDLGASLRFDGTAGMALTLPWGETRAGVALRATANGLVEITWDGNGLAATPVSSGPIGDLDQAVFLAGSDVAFLGGGRLCRVSSCRSPPCAPVVASCEGALGLSVDAQRVWFQSVLDNADALAVYRDRAALGGPDRFVRVPRTPFSHAPFEARVEQFIFNRPAWNTEPGVSVFPAVDGDGGWLQQWRHGGELVAASDDWLIARTGPNALRFHRMR